jgi:hypothetical protein
VGWGLGLAFDSLGLAAPGKTSASVAAKSETTRRRRFMRTREAVQLVVASGSREKSEVIHGAKAAGRHEVRPSAMAEVRCGGPGVRGQGPRVLSSVARPVLIDLFNYGGIG